MIPYILMGIGFISIGIAVNYRTSKIEKEIDKIKEEVSFIQGRRLVERIYALELAFKAKAAEPKTKEEITTQLINEWLNGPQEEEE